ncbi:MAG: YfhO family protein, partial [Bacteroidetes bacterium]|nr:YfhO family protein [Bacteroidota bacterium]
QQANDIVKEVIGGLRDDRRSLYGGDLLRSIILMALVFGALWAYAKDKLKKEIVMAVIIVLGSFDLLLVAHRYIHSDSFDEPDQADAFPATAADTEIGRDTGYYRVFDLSGGDPFVDPRASYFHNSLGGYSPAKLGLYQDIIERQLTKNNMQVLNMLNTKYFIQQNPSNGQLMAQQNPGANGPAWFVKGIVYAKNADEEMGMLDHLNTKDSVVVDNRFKSIAAAQPVYDSAASIVLEKNVNDTIVYKTKAATPQFAVFSEVYYPHGWEALIDGKKTDYARVDYLLRGMPVPAGEHTIEFRFAPASYYNGGKITLALDSLFWLALLIGIAGLFRKKKEQPLEKA